MRKSTQHLGAFIQSEEGATAVEYGLMLALIAAVIMVAVKSLGGKVNGAFTSVDSQWP